MTKHYLKKCPKDFLNEEVRCGYLISSKMKKVWAIEINLLAHFISVCDRHGLCYFLNGGSLLGAARHQGFIPWDDDIDIMMPRTDYNKLCSLADKEFLYPYFLQTTLTEKNFFRSHAQLRDSTTTGCLASERRRSINRGIFIDIFPIDGIPDGAVGRLLFKYQVLLFKKFFALTLVKDPEQLSMPILLIRKCALLIYKIVPLPSLFGAFERLLSKYSNQRTNYVGEISLKFTDQGIWKSEWFDDYIFLDFENLKVKVPTGYRSILGKQYGSNWAIVPDPKSAVIRKNCHGNLILDPDVPYEDYFR